MVAVVTDGTAVLGLGRISDRSGYAGYGRKMCFSSKSSAVLMHFLYAYAAKTWMIS